MCSYSLYIDSYILHCYTTIVELLVKYRSKSILLFRITQIFLLFVMVTTLGKMVFISLWWVLSIPQNNKNVLVT